MSELAHDGPGRQLAGRARVLLGCVAGLAMVLVLLRIRGEAHRSGGVISTLRAGDHRLLAAALGVEAISYLLPGLVLLRLVPGLRYGSALRVALASLGVGSLLPGNPATGGGIGFAELRRLGIARSDAAASSLALVIGVPAASMAVLAGPTLIGSGLAAPLPAGWRGVVLAAGLTAIALACVIGVSLVSPGRIRHAERTLNRVGGRRNARTLLWLGLGTWVADAGCLWLTGIALHVWLPLASLPMAYIAGVAIMALPILPGGLGAVEAALPAIFAAGGASFPAAVIVVVAWRVLSFWIPTVAGLGALVSLHRWRALPVTSSASE